MKNSILKNLFGSLFLMVVIISFISVIPSCKEDEEIDTKKEYVLVIENGAQSINPDETINYKANLVDEDGVVTEATNVTWTSSNASYATISTTGAITTVGQGMVTITASVKVGEKTYTATVPLGIYAPSLFTVSPCAILYEVGGSLQLEAIHLSTSGVVEPTCTYVSSDATVASVSNSGLVTFNKAGDCFITVKATSLNGEPTCIVPVAVIAPFVIELPVCRVEISPSSKDLFKNETVTLSAKAYNFDNEEVSGKTPIWTSGNTSIATVSATGLVTPVNTGETFIYGTIDGMIGQANIIVNPDTLVVVDPFWASIAAGGTKQFTATAYHLTRTSATPYTGVNFSWEIPTFGLDEFDIATVNSTGLVTVKSDATIGFPSFVAAYITENPYIGGAAAITVAMADNCDCGAENPNVDHITASSSTINLMYGQNAQITATAYDASNNVVAADLVYCSDNFQTASVTTDGFVMALAAGTSIIKICVGDVYTTVTVNVTSF